MADEPAWRAASRQTWCKGGRSVW